MQPFVIGGLGGPLQYIEHHLAVANLIFSAVVAASTLAYVFLTGGLVAETRRMRRLESEPFLDVYLVPNARAINILDVVIQNTGRAPIRNIRWSWRLPAELQRFRIADADMPFAPRISALGVNQRIELPLLNMVGSQEIENLQPLIVEADYEGPSGRRKSDVFTLQADSFMYFIRLGERPEDTAAAALKELADRFSSIVGGSQWLRVMATTEERQAAWYRKRVKQYESARGRLSQEEYATHLASLYRARGEADAAWYGAMRSHGVGSVQAQQALEELLAASWEVAYFREQQRVQMSG
jgi:hypothetical protein